jgi:hypothetical protein
MRIFSLSHVIELAAQLPPPSKEIASEEGYTPVIRLPLRDWDAVRDSEHPEREFDAHKDAFVEFEVVPWKDTRGITTRRWVLRGLVAV